MEKKGPESRSGADRRKGGQKVSPGQKKNKEQIFFLTEERKMTEEMCSVDNWTTEGR